MKRSVFEKFIIVKKNQTPLWNLIVSPLESAIFYKFLIFQKIPYRERFYQGNFCVHLWNYKFLTSTAFVSSKAKSFIKLAFYRKIKIF